jgi:hypothetical protein
LYQPRQSANLQEKQNERHSCEKSETGSKRTVLPLSCEVTMVTHLEGQRLLLSALEGEVQEVEAGLQAHSASKLNVPPTDITEGFDVNRLHEL